MGEDQLQTRWQIAVIVAGMLLRLAIAPLAVHPGDEPAFARWGRAIQAGGLIEVYQNSDANYPPLGIALLGASVWINDLFVPGEGSGPEGIGWRVALKLPAILADLGLMLMAALTSTHGPSPFGSARKGRGERTHHGASRQGRHLWPIALVAFNPALILMSGYWGQLDSVYVALGLFSVLLAARGRAGWAGVVLGAALGVKLQAVVILPAVLLLCMHRGDRRVTHTARLGIGFGAMILLLCAPWVMRGEASMLAARLIAVKAGPGWLTLNALNAWYLFSGGLGNWVFNAPLTSPDSAALVGTISARSVGLLLWAVWSAITLWGGWRRFSTQGSDRDGLWMAGLMWLGMFLWPTGAHERYALGAVGAWALAAGQGNSRMQGSALPYQAAILGGLMALNILWAAPVLPGLLGGFMGVRWIGMGLSAAMLAVGMWGMVSIWWRSEVESD